MFKPEKSLISPVRQDFSANFHMSQFLLVEHKSPTSDFTPLYASFGSSLVSQKQGTYTLFHEKFLPHRDKTGNLSN